VTQDSIPALDEPALQRLRELDPSGKNQLLERVLGAFETSLLRLAPQLREAATSGDKDTIRHVVHTLKSSSASVGALDLARLCAEIEAAMKQSSPDRLLELLAEVDREMGLVLQAVQATRSVPT